ncbi:MAG: hypothetical protein JWN04_5276 [Myxococcaceae bacterium]|nr:hypothetical protein [Myxococcaceae bacterium]
MRTTIVVAILLCTLSARADSGRARAQQVARALESAARARDQGKSRTALQKLRASLSRFAGEPALLGAYAALLLPLTDERPSPDSPQRAATELLRQIERARSVPGNELATRDPERERVIRLHAALAEGVLGHFERAFEELIEAGRLQDVSTLLCLRQLAVLAVRGEQLLVAEQALGMARQYMPQDPLLPGELGRVMLARGKVGAAVGLLSERLVNAGTDLGARADLAYAIAAQGRAGEALALLNRTREECQRARACALLAARIALEAERPQDAVTFASPWAVEHDLDALFLLADAELRRGDPAAARVAYEQVLVLRPESVRAKQGLEQLPRSNTERR